MQDAYKSLDILRDVTRESPELGVTADMFALFDTLQSSIDDATLLAPNAKTINALSNSIAYTLKIASLNTAAQIYSLPSLHDFVDDLTSNGEIYRTISALKDRLDLGAETDMIRDYSHAFSIYRDTVQAILEDPLLNVALSGKQSDAVRVSLLETLQGFSDVDILRWGEDGKRLTDRVIKKLTEQVNTNRMPRLLNQKSLLQQIEKETGHSMAGLIQNLHRASVDIEANQIILGHFLKRKFSATELPIYLDIETTALKSGDILSIAYKLPGMDAAKEIKIQGSIEHMPSDELLEKLLFPEGTADLTPALLERRFRDEFITAPGLRSENEALSEFCRDIFNAMGDGKKTPVLVGHNIKAFDIPYLLGHIRKLDNRELSSFAYDLFQDSRLYDTFVELQKRDGYLILSEEQKLAIGNIIKNHMNNLSHMEYISNIPKTLFPQMNKGFVGLLHGIATAMADAGQSLEIVQRLKDLGDDILTVLSLAKQFGKKAGQQGLIFKEAFPHAAADALHISQLLTLSPEVITYLASRRSLDMPALKNFFDVEKLAKNGVGKEVSCNNNYINHFCFNMYIRI
jgi:uncharacterized protein YprB with RNaseH-like and TPR domain